MSKIEIKNVSCFDFLPKIKDDSVDLFLIDPPYIISKDTGLESCVNGVERFKMSYKFGEWDESFTGLNIVIEEAYRTLKKGGTFICFYDIWKITILKEMMEKEKFKQIRFIEWVKNNPVPINSKINYLTNSREIALTGTKIGKPTFNSEYDDGIYNFPICHEKGRFHPTQKPLSLIKKLVEKHSNENDLILDCFLGSGTTAAACLETNRNFIGCELDSSYYEKIIQRMECYNDKS